VLFFFAIENLAWGQSTEPTPANPTGALAAPATNLTFVQYGAAITSETRLASGNICPAQASAPCILGSGGGFLVRVGLRTATAWYGGVSYEVSRQSSSNLINLPILQQLRGEFRRYLVSGLRLSPYLSAAVGLVGYGDEWAVSTFGPVVSVGVGIAFEVTPEVYVGLAPAYRIFALRGWRDDAGQQRPSGLVHFLALELTLDSRTPLPRY